MAFLASSPGATADVAQVIVVSHNEKLISLRREASDTNVITLTKNFGETTVEGLSNLDAPR